MAEVKYIFTILERATRWKCAVSLTPKPLYAQENGPGIYWI
jgi:hypothetical protein